MLWAKHDVAILCDKDTDDPKFNWGERMLAACFYTDEKSIRFYRQLENPVDVAGWGPTPHRGANQCASCGKPADLLFRPCMHAVACQACCARIGNATQGLGCPACRALVLETMHIAGAEWKA